MSLSSNAMLLAQAFTLNRFPYVCNGRPSTSHRCSDEHKGRLLAGHSYPALKRHCLWQKISNRGVPCHSSNNEVTPTRPMHRRTLYGCIIVSTRECFWLHHKTYYPDHWSAPVVISGISVSRFHFEVVNVVV
jgi:hypothetical protein